jgi:DNA-directed RNA polymerase subunit RPC12/RpoP
MTHPETSPSGPVKLPRCPACDARLLPNPDGAGLWCQFCGVVRDDDEAHALRDRAGSALSPSDYQPPGRDPFMSGDLHRALDHAWECIQAGDPVTAAYILRQAQPTFPESADIWYLLSLTTADRGEQFGYLTAALEAQPYHRYAWRDKGILEGVIPTGDAPEQAEPAGPVEAEAATGACPLCGGALAHDAALGLAVCAHCGFRPDQPRLPAARSGFDPLEHALLQRRFGFTREWRIGARVLRCGNCAAQLTLAGAALSTVCPFCGGAHVLVADAVGSFEQPDALLPFRIDRRTAARSVDHRLGAARRGVVRGELWGVYLPFWSFSGTASVTAPPGSEPAWPGTSDLPEVLVGGVTHPRQAALENLMPYHLRDLIAYDPRHLARWPAQVYSVDVIQASITARADFKRMARRRFSGHDRDLSPAVLSRTDASYSPPDTPFWGAARVDVGRLEYRLLLLPAWMIILYLQSGARLPALVNGQTGEAVILASFDDPDRILAGAATVPAQDLPQPRPSPIRPLPPRE